MKKILVVGDIIEDRYEYVTSERECSEAPLPVFDLVRVETRPGGAANVALNLVSLGDDISVSIAGICSRDMFWQLMMSVLTEEIIVSEIPIIKTRTVHDNGLPLRDTLISRVDNRKKWESADVKRFEESILSIDREQYDAIVISDYRMGTVTEKIAKFLCENSPCKVFVDSKSKDLTMFRGAYALKLNREEHAYQLTRKDYVVESIAGHTVVTLGADGAQVSTYETIGRTLVPTYKLSTLVFPTENVPVVDVTGCGDTFTAALAYFITNRIDDIFTATKFANLCASKVVQKFGTSV